jgi:hypothetical protein
MALGRAWTAAKRRVRGQEKFQYPFERISQRVGRTCLPTRVASPVRANGLVPGLAAGLKSLLHCLCLKYTQLFY